MEVSESMDICSLPSLVVSKVLSFLSWKVKLDAVSAIPYWEQHLRCPTSWPIFISDLDNTSSRQMLKQRHKASCTCILDYGQYIQHCTIVLQYLDFRDMGLELLEFIATNCVSLKTFRLYHPQCFTFSKQVTMDRYVSALTTLSHSCKYLKHISLCRLEYLPLNKKAGILELFDHFVERDVVRYLRELDFSHAFDFSTPLPILMLFCNLQKLKCPIQALQTHVITILVKNSLVDLYVVNDGSTLNENFQEDAEINWKVVAKEAPHLRIHYIIQGRTWSVSDLVQNPLIHTLVVDSLCMGLDNTLLSSVGRVYGASLKVFAHLATEWNFQPYNEFSGVAQMYASLLSHCNQLHTFVTAVDIPALALVLIAANRRLSNLWVDKERILFDFEQTFDLMGPDEYGENEHVDWWQSVTSSLPPLQKILTNFLQFSWRPLDVEELDEAVKPLISF